MVNIKNTDIIRVNSKALKLIDWHSHILPNMDDGSRNVEESIELINSQLKQGVKTVIATPHFYANDESVESFLNRRNSSFKKLMESSNESFPKIYLGAEVRYYQGISRMSNIKDLRIGDSELILIEMPAIRWTESVIKELIELSGMSGIKVVLAHIDRYIGLQSQNVWERLIESGILMQANASFFLSFSSKCRAFSMLKNGYIHFVGSDCHNMKTRPPCIGKVFELIKNKFGNDFVCEMNEFGYSLL